jgi:hypothetical protein
VHEQGHPPASDAAMALEAAMCRRLAPGDEPASAAVSSDMLQVRGSQEAPRCVNPCHAECRRCVAVGGHRAKATTAHTAEMAGLTA